MLRKFGAGTVATANNGGNINIELPVYKTAKSGGLYLKIYISAMTDGTTAKISNPVFFPI